MTTLRIIFVLLCTLPFLYLAAVLTGKSVDDAKNSAIRAKRSQAAQNALKESIGRESKYRSGRR